MFGKSRNPGYVVPKLHSPCFQSKSCLPPKKTDRHKFSNINDLLHFVTQITTKQIFRLIAFNTPLLRQTQSGFESITHIEEKLSYQNLLFGDVVTLTDLSKPATLAFFLNSLILFGLGLTFSSFTSVMTVLVTPNGTSLLGVSPLGSSGLCDPACING